MTYCIGCKRKKKRAVPGRYWTFWSRRRCDPEIQKDFSLPHSRGGEPLLSDDGARMKNDSARQPPYVPLTFHRQLDHVLRGQFLHPAQILLAHYAGRQQARPGELMR